MSNIKLEIKQQGGINVKFDAIGIPGPQGESVKVLGSLLNTGKLPLKNNTRGDGYTVPNSSGILHLWTWTGTMWINGGRWQGPDGPTGGIKLLTTDSSLYKEDNEIRANVSSYKQDWSYEASSYLMFDFEPTNILQVIIDRGDKAIFPKWTYLAPKTLSITSSLEPGDKIKTIYEYFIIQP